MNKNCIKVEKLSKNFINNKVVVNVLNNLNEALTRAIEDEDYEVAAKLRDRIQYIKKDI